MVCQGGGPHSAQQGLYRETGAGKDKETGLSLQKENERADTGLDNTHEAIIPAEQFELVQRILETETRRTNDAETVALFAGFLYCGDCGSRQNKGSCTSHNLRDEKLHNIVRNALQIKPIREKHTKFPVGQNRILILEQSRSVCYVTAFSFA